MAEILTKDLTTGSIHGTGVFDEMQKAFMDNIKHEYQKNRINGPEYSQVYLGGMQAAMQNAVSFLLGRQKADKEAELINEKIETENLLQQKLLKEIELLGKQIQKAEAEIWVTKAQVSDNLAITVAPSSFIDKGVLGRQARKTMAETDLLRQKTTTELAQTNAQAARVNGNSVVGKEILLRQRQADGFYRDAEQKLAKIAGDSYNVQFTTLDGPGEGGSVPGHLTSGGVNNILNMAVRGVQSQT